MNQLNIQPIKLQSISYCILAPLLIKLSSFKNLLHMRKMGHLILKQPTHHCKCLIRNEVIWIIIVELFTDFVEKNDALNVYGPLNMRSRPKEFREVKNYALDPA